MNTEWFRGSRWVVNDVDRVFYTAPGGLDVHVLDANAMEREGVREGIEEGRRVFGNDSQSRRTTPFLFGSPFSGVGCQVSSLLPAIHLSLHLPSHWTPLRQEDSEDSEQLRCVVPACQKENARVLSTGFRVLERFGHFCLLEVRLWTGFRHQIRVHLKEIGHPLAADPLYGARGSLYLSNLKGRGRYRSKAEPEKPILDRLSLHALSIRFAEVPSGEIQQVEAPLPRDLAFLLKALRKYDT